MSKDKVLKLGEHFQNLIKALESASRNINDIDNEKFLEEYDGCDNGDSRAFFLRRKFRQSISELYNFGESITKQDITDMLFPMSVCCFSQDWDKVFESISHGTDDRDFEFVNDTKEFDDVVKVRSWGGVDPRFDVKFLKHMRNGIAHSKFEYDFENQQIKLNHYRGSFVVDMPMNFFAGLPESLWGLAENSSSENADHRINLLGSYPFDTAFSVLCKNNMTLGDKPKIKLQKETRDFLDNMRKHIESGKKLSLIGRLNALSLVVEIETNVGNNMTKDDQKRVLDILSYAGLEVLEEEEIDLFYTVHKFNDFLSAITDYLFSSEIEDLTIDQRKKAITEVISIRIDDRNNNFYPYYFTYMMMRNLKSKSQGGFAKNLMGTAVPYVFDEIQEFVERSYFNYCFNYIPERFGISDTVRSTSIDSVFGTETVISERDVESFLNHLRNSVVHPVRAVKSGENYILCDKHKGKTTFFAEIPTQKLMDYAGFVLNSCVNECERKEEIEKV